MAAPIIYLTCDPVAIVSYSGKRFGVSKRRLSAASAVFAAAFEEVKDMPDAEDENKLPEIKIPPSSFHVDSFAEILTELHRLSLRLGETPTVVLDLNAKNCRCRYKILHEYAIPYEFKSDRSVVGGYSIGSDGYCVVFCEMLSLAADYKDKKFIAKLLNSKVEMTLPELRNKGMRASLYSNPKNVLSFSKLDAIELRVLLIWLTDK